jgi:hypothetical protein
MPVKAAQQPQVDWSTAQPIQSDQVDWGSALPVTKPAAPPAEQPGFWENFGHAFGIGKEEREQAEADARAHPIRNGLKALIGGPELPVAEGLYGGAKRSLGEIGKGIDSLSDAPKGQHNWAGLASHAISAVPFIGPAIDKMAEESPPTRPGQSYASQVFADATRGNLGTALGTAAQVAPLVLGGLDTAAPKRPLLGEIPTRAKAGKVFDSVMQDAGDQPVNLTRAMAPLERAQQLSARGGGNVAAADNLYKRINTVNPLDYREARDWASNLSRISGQDKMSASPALRAQVARLSHAFNEDIGDTASSVGRGEDYAKAMRDYRRASVFNNAAKTAAKWAIPAAAGGGALGYALRKLLP